MIALTLGDEKSPNPRPRTARSRTIAQVGVRVPKKMNGTSATVVSPIPTDASVRDSTRSDSRPASGDSAAMITGCATRIKPAVWGDRPLIYCRYRLNNRPTAEVAL